MKVIEMRLVKDILEIKQAITNCKSHGDEWYTNYYIDDEAATDLIRKKKLNIAENEYSFFLLRRKHNFYLLYFFASSIDGLATGIKSLIDTTSETLSVDVIHKKNLISNKVFLTFSEAGFDRRIRLYRMRKGKCLPPKSKLPDVHYAVIDDVDIIDTMLHCEFDELCEQIPDKDEIEAAVKKQHIIVIKEDLSLVSFFWFERNRQTVLWRYWLTNPQYRAGSIAGIILLQQVMALHNDAIQTLLWVREDNQKVIMAHEKNGFQRDGLIDDVYCLIR